MRSKKLKFVQFRFQKLSLELFGSVNFDHLARITLPALPQFTAAVAEELFCLIGPRRLTSLVQRIQRQGPWKEKISVSKKIKLENGASSYTYVQTGKYEHELKVLQTIKQLALPWENYRDAKSEMIFSPQRIDELLVLMSPNLAAKSDDEIASTMNDWIQTLRSNCYLPEPLREDQLEDYQSTFQPRGIRLSRNL